MSLSSEESSSPDFVQALARGLSVIECFDEEHSRMTLSEVARRVGLSRPSARRALLTLQSLGYVSADGDRFSLTARTLRLGYAYLASEPLWELARHRLDRLREEIAQNCSIGVLDDNEVVVVARSSVRRMVSDEISVGFRWPAYCTALGRVLLSGLPVAQLEAYLDRTELRRYTALTLVSKVAVRRAVREAAIAGWARADQELDVELRSIAVPIADNRGNMMAALHVSGRAHLVTMADMERESLPALRRAADDIAKIAVAHGR